MRASLAPAAAAHTMSACGTPAVQIKPDGVNRGLVSPCWAFTLLAQHASCPAPRIVTPPLSVKRVKLALAHTSDPPSKVTPVELLSRVTSSPYTYHDKIATNQGQVYWTRAGDGHP